MNESLFKKLQSAGIRHFDEKIHEQKKEWLIDKFKKGRKTYPVNVTKLVRNVIWQLKERIQSGERRPLKELIRTCWYMYIKPTLFRAGALSRTTDQYSVLTDNLAYLVAKRKLMSYTDIGFRDQNRSNRKIGINANIILFSEKASPQDFLREMHEKYQVTVIILGKQPSVLSSEYFVNDLKARGVNLRRSFYLFSIVDFDPSGWIVRNSFINQLKAFGIKNIKYLDCIHPDMLTPFEIEMSKYRVPAKKDMVKKNKNWLKEVEKMNYNNFKHMAPVPDPRRKGKTETYGLESESVSSERLKKVLDEKLEPLVGKSERILKIYQLEQFNETMKSLMIQKLT